MEEKVQLKHPAAKKAILMDRAKYETLKHAITKYLAKHGEATHTEIWKGVEEDFKKHKTKFEGAIHWNLEWVKLDLEANKIIKRLPGKSPQKYALTGR